MKPSKYAVATTELLLMLPALLFMTALFVRDLQPSQYEPAHTAYQVVAWYAARPHIGLWLLLIALPLTVLVTGAATVWRKWSAELELRHAAQQTLVLLRPHMATLLVTGATLASAGVLMIVALHVLTD